MRVVELLQERQGFGLVLGGEHSGQLRGERGIVGSSCERGAEEGFGIGILLAHDEKMRKAGVGRDGIGIFGENAAIGGFGGVDSGRLFRRARRRAECLRWFPARA